MANRNKHKKYLLSSLITVFALTFFLRTVPAGERLRWTGCGITKKAFMVEAVKDYITKTGTIIALSGGGATKGIREAGNGAADIGGSCRPSLNTRFPAEEGDIYMTVVAWDALVPIVNSSNPLNSLTMEQLKDILLGKTTSWKEVGGTDAKILVVGREGKISGVGYMTRKIIFNDPDTEFSPDALLLKSSGPVEKRIQHDEMAIAMTGVSSAQKMLQEGKPVKIVKLDGMEADMANIASGTYPAFRPLYLMTKGMPDGASKKFLDWITSPDGQKVVELSGTVSLAQGKGLKDKFQYWENTDRIVNFSSVL